MKVDHKKSLNAYLAGFSAWMIPGAGHVLQGRVWRGVLLGGTICILFFIGLTLKGHLFTLHSSDDAGALAYVFSLFNLGTGLLYLGCLFGAVGLAAQAQIPTAEYGNLFLMVAGLLNYLVMLDAFDIAVGRKF